MARRQEVRKHAPPASVQLWLRPKQAETRCCCTKDASDSIVVFSTPSVTTSAALRPVCSWLAAHLTTVKATEATSGQVSEVSPIPETPKWLCGFERKGCVAKFRK